MYKPTVYKTTTLLSACVLLLWAAGCAGNDDFQSDAPIMLAETARLPTTAMTPTGDAAYVTWVETDQGLSNVYLTVLREGKPPAPRIRVNDRAGDAAAHPQAPPQVVTGPEGNVYVAWVVQTPVEGRRFPASSLRLARSTDGGRSFSPAVTVNDAVGFPTSHHFHDIAVGPDGTVYVSWLDSRESDRARMETPAHDGTAPAHPHHHGGEQQGSSAGAGTDLRVARSIDGGRSFEPSVVVDRNTCQCCRTALATGRDGTLYVAWRKIFGENVRDMAIAYSTDRGQTFSAPGRIHEDGWQIDGCPHTGPALAVDNSGRVHAAWYTGAAGKAGIYYAVAEDVTRGFGLPVSLTAGGTAPVSQVRLIGTGQEGIVLAWEDPRAGVVHLARATPEQAWTPVEVAAVPGNLPAVAAANGKFTLAWQNEAAALVHAAALPEQSRPEQQETALRAK